MCVFEVVIILVLWSTVSFLFLIPAMDHNSIVGPLILSKSMSVGNMIRFVICLPISIVANIACTNAFACFWKSLINILCSTPFDKKK